MAREPRTTLALPKLDTEEKTLDVRLRLKGKAAVDLADYQRAYGLFDEETIAAVDKFREDKGLTYAGNPPGLVDERLVTALRAAYLDKKKTMP